MTALDEKLMSAWRELGRELGVRVVAPYTVRGTKGQSVECEVYLPDFGSPTGALVISRRTERRERALLRSIPDIWRSIAGRDPRSGKEVLEDLEWFGPAGQEPSWYRKKSAWNRSLR